MRLLIVGSGGREHALAWKLRRSPALANRDDLICVPGNAGIEAEAVCLPAPPGGINDAAAMADLVQAHAADLTIVGPEAPLLAGLADELGRRGLAVCGPTRAAARLEGSKVFAKQFMARHGIPTAAFGEFSSSRAALDYLEAEGRRYPLVVKADGIAAGKGVVVAADPGEARDAVLRMMEERQFGAAGERVVIEEHLEGVEISFFALCDGGMAVPLGSAQDHKRIFDGETGPNTGGMGAVSPSVDLDPALQQRIMDRIIGPVVRGMAEEGTPYRGILFAGLMLTHGLEANGGALVPKVLEFNARFGDPETQALLRRLDTDLLPLLAAAAAGDLREAPPVVFAEDWAACVVASSRGYPVSSESGRTIAGLEAAGAAPGVVVFHAATTRDSGEGAFLTAGGRVLAVSATGGSLDAALRRAYAGIGSIHFDGMHYRRDIGARGLERLAAKQRTGRQG